jgi:hypothetical protein
MAEPSELEYFRQSYAAKLAMLLIIATVVGFSVAWHGHTALNQNSSPPVATQGLAPAAEGATSQPRQIQ